MFEFQERQFINLVREVYGSTMGELGFEFDEEDLQVLYARKGDIQLVFRLETGFKFRLFRLEIMLLGELGERATPRVDHRSLDVSTIAEFSDLGYEFVSRIPATESEFVEEMNIQKAELLKYCQDILDGDVTRWSQIVDSVIEESGWQPG